jgi:hypothetical protein
VGSQPLSDESGLTSLTSLDEVGQAVVMHTHGTDVVIVGRVSHFSGDSFGDVCPVIHAYTPGGSTFYGGRVWMRPPTPSEMEKLVYYEEEARNRGCPENYWDPEAWREPSVFDDFEPPTGETEWAARHIDARCEAIENLSGRPDEASRWGTPRKIEIMFLGLLTAKLILGGKHNYEEARETIESEWKRYAEDKGDLFTRLKKLRNRGRE